MGEVALRNKIPIPWELNGNGFRSEISYMDGDKQIERRGNFMQWELKHEDEPMSLGQNIFLESLSKAGPFTVLVGYGMPPDRVDRFEVVYGPERWMIHTSRQDFESFWEDIATQNPNVVTWPFLKERLNPNAYSWDPRSGLRAAAQRES